MSLMMLMRAQRSASYASAAAVDSARYDAIRALRQDDDIRCYRREARYACAERRAICARWREQPAGGRKMPTCYDAPCARICCQQRYSDGAGARERYASAFTIRALFDAHAMPLCYTQQRYIERYAAVGFRKYCSRYDTRYARRYDARRAMVMPFIVDCYA